VRRASPCVWTRVHRFEWGNKQYEQRDAVFAPRTLAKILPAILASEYPDEPIALDDARLIRVRSAQPSTGFNAR